MTVASSIGGLAELDQFVHRFEQARQTGSRETLQSFIPLPQHPMYSQVVRELVRVDLELAWANGSVRPLDDYCSEFPDVFRDASALEDIAFEEFRRAEIMEKILQRQNTPNGLDYRPIAGRRGSVTGRTELSHTAVDTEMPPTTAGGFESLCRRVRTSRAEFESQLLPPTVAPKSGSPGAAPTNGPHRREA